MNEEKEIDKKKERKIKRKRIRNDKKRQSVSRWNQKGTQGKEEEEEGTE